MNNEIISDEVITEQPHPNFIEGNTSAITLEDLKTKCIIPSFGMTNELTLSHQEIAESIIKAAAERYGKTNLTEMEYRVSHPIAGRIPSAIHRKATELLEHEKTLFYQRIAAYSMYPGCRNKNLYILASFFRYDGIPEDIATDYLVAYYHDNINGFPASEIGKTVESAYK